MRKTSFFSLISAMILAASFWAQASTPPAVAEVATYSYTPAIIAYLPALDLSADHVSIVENTSHTAVTPIRGIIANWQPGGSGNVAYKLLMPEPPHYNRVVRRFVAASTEVGWTA